MCLNTPAAQCPQFSIITATYNSAKTLSCAIDSVANQTYQNYEHIIIDGASQDGTVDIIKEYSKKYPNKIKWISEADNGIYYAINKGIDLARGDVVGVLGSDDSYLPKTFEIAADEFKKSCDLKVVYGLVNVFFNGVHIETSGRHHNNLSNSTLSHQAVFLSKKIHDVYGKYDTAFRISADYDFLLKIKDKKEISFLNLNLPLANYSQNGLSSNSSMTYLEAEKVRYKNNIITKTRYLKNILKYNIRNFLRL